MSASTSERFFGCQHAFDYPFTKWVVIMIGGLFVVSWAVNQLLWRTGVASRAQYDDIRVRWKSWVWVALVVLAPILLGAAWVILGVLALSLLCYREFARATGLFRETSISIIVVLGIISLACANADHYDRMYFSNAPLTLGALSVMTIPRDEPKGYIQRVALGLMGFLMFGYSLGYLGMIANDERFRPFLLLIFVGVEMNDVFAYCVGKAVGGPKALPKTSPGKTVSGCAGALVLTTGLVAILGHWVFCGTSMGRLDRLLILGFMMSILGQTGDLTLSSIKRDLGVKDLGGILPGHGGLLDRVDSLVLVVPPVFHYLCFHLGALGSNQAARIFTGE
ncbi:MAG: phosphatidate cytidylyltransferase [Verrucomicrobiota bacterium]|jgi:phosphatidate cytidylyltransferase